MINPQTLSLFCSCHFLKSLQKFSQLSFYLALILYIKNLLFFVYLFFVLFFWCLTLGPCFSLQRCLHVDQLAGRRCWARRQRVRGPGPRSPGNQRSPWGTLPYRRRGGHGGPWGHTNQLKGGEATDASEGRIPGWSVGSNLRGLQYVNQKQHRHKPCVEIQYGGLYKGCPLLVGQQLATL